MPVKSANHVGEVAKWIEYSPYWVRWAEVKSGVACSRIVTFLGCGNLVTISYRGCLRLRALPHKSIVLVIPAPFNWDRTRIPASQTGI